MFEFLRYIWNALTGKGNFEPDVKLEINKQNINSNLNYYF